METKETLRSIVLARRDALPMADRVRKSEAICRRLEHDLAAAFADSPNRMRPPLVAAFSPMRSEVDVRPFVEAAYRRGWDVCFPCMVRETPGEPSHMRFYRVPQEQAAAAEAGFLAAPMRCLPCAALEADGFEAVASEELDAVVVPLVAFDDAGGRLGYGGGNYDRLLPLLRDDAVVAGVAFEEQRVDRVPCEPHDQPLPRVVSA